MISSRVQIAVEIVAFPSWISVWAFPSHTSVPWDRPAIRTRSEKLCGFVSTSICMAKSVPNSGIPRAPRGQPPISSGVIPSALCILEKRHHFFVIKRNVFYASRSMSVSSSIRIMVGSSCPRISSFRQVVVNGMVIKMRRNDIRCHIIRRMLYRCKGMDLFSATEVR